MDEVPFGRVASEKKRKFHDQTIIPRINPDCHQKSFDP